MPTAIDCFELCFGASDAAAFLTDADGRVLRANAALARRLGRMPGWRPAPDGGDLLAPGAVQGDGLAPGGAPSPDPVAALRAARARAAALPGASIACDAPLRDADGRIDRARLSVRRLGRGPRAPWLHELAPADPDRVVARLRQALDRAEKAQRQLAILAETAPVALFEYLAHPDERVEVPYFNARLPENMGVTAAEIEADGAAMLAHIPPEDLEAMRASIDETVATRRAQGFSFRVMHPAKGERQLVAWATPAPQPDGAVLWYCANFDVTAQRDAEARAEEADAELRRARERLSDVAEIAPVGLYEFRMGPDGALSFPLLSARATELLGWSDRSRPPGPDRVFDRIVPDDLPGLMASIAESRADLSRWNRRMRVRDGARGVIWVQGASSPRADPDGGVTWRGVLFDVTEDVRREEELKRAHRLAEAMRIENERQALHDGLTALPNRRAYDRTLEARIEAARAGTLPPGCILVRIDLDHFKHVNDTLGHEAGDHVLRRVADVLRARLRAGDFAARIGGDEFSVLLSPGASVAQAEEVVARIQTDLAEPLLHAGRQCRFGASFGLAEADLTGAGMEIQIFADAALYRAKSAGRNRLELFTPELHRSILDDRAMATELQEALERDEFTPFFQPQVDARDGRLVGAETLLRWRHPTRGLLAPDRFMHVAAQLRLVNEVDRRMMLRTGEVLDRWARLGFTPPKVSFNVSAGRMHDADVVDIARQLAARPCKIAMELLESTLVEDESDAFHFNLDRLREAGIEVEIDDFGSGHASIVGLMQLAPDALKIDRRLIAPIASSARARSVIRAIIEIAETLNIATVAEGVETPEQARILRDLGCGVLQGFLFSRPVDEDAFLAFAAARQTRGVA